MVDYVYAMLERPPMPGAQPREGLLSINAFDGTAIIDGQERNIWGMVEYDRKLSEYEREHYSMALIYTRNM